MAINEDQGEALNVKKVQNDTGRGFEPILSPFKSLIEQMITETNSKISRIADVYFEKHAPRGIRRKQQIPSPKVQYISQILEDSSMKKSANQIRQAHVNGKKDIVMIDLYELVSQFEKKCIKKFKLKIFEMIINDAVNGIEEVWKLNVSNYVTNRTRIYAEKQVCFQKLVVSVGNPRYSRELERIEKSASETNAEYMSNLSKFEEEMNASIENLVFSFVGKLEFVCYRLSMIFSNMLVFGDEDKIASIQAEGEMGAVKTVTRPQSAGARGLERELGTADEQQRVSANESKLDEWKLLPLENVFPKFLVLCSGYKSMPFLTIDMQRIFSGQLTTQILHPSVISLIQTLQISRIDAFDSVSKIASGKMLTASSQSESETQAETQWNIYFQNHLHRVKSLNC